MTRTDTSLSIILPFSFSGVSGAKAHNRPWISTPGGRGGASLHFENFGFTSTTTLLRFPNRPCDIERSARITSITCWIASPSDDGGEARHTHRRRRRFLSVAQQARRYEPRLTVTQLELGEPEVIQVMRSQRLRGVEGKQKLASKYMCTVHICNYIRI